MPVTPVAIVTGAGPMVAPSTAAAPAAVGTSRTTGACSSWIGARRPVCGNRVQVGSTTCVCVRKCRCCWLFARGRAGARPVRRAEFGRDPRCVQLCFWAVPLLPCLLENRHRLACRPAAQACAVRATHLEGDASAPAEGCCPRPCVPPLPRQPPPVAPLLLVQGSRPAALHLQPPSSPFAPGASAPGWGSAAAPLVQCRVVRRVRGLPMARARRQIPVLCHGAPRPACCCRRPPPLLLLRSLTPESAMCCGLRRRLRGPPPVADQFGTGCRECQEQCTLKQSTVHGINGDQCTL